MSDIRAQAHRRATAVRRTAVVAVLALSLTILGCDADTPSSETKAPTSPVAEGATTPSAPSTEGPILVTVGDGTIAGSCMGASQDGTPTVILVAGLGNPGSQLSTVRDALEAQTRVCWYDRPGMGASDPVAHPQSLTSVVDDLASFLERAAIEPPYVLVGHSFGASEVIRYAQVHPDEVTGFVAMNPVPPYTEYIRRAQEVETPQELQTNEIDFYEGRNEEGIDLTDTDLMLEPVPDEMPYVILQSENCPGDFCERIKPVLRKATEELLGHLGAGGRFVAFPDRPHDLYSTNLKDVVAEVTELL